MSAGSAFYAHDGRGPATESGRSFVYCFFIKYVWLPLILKRSGGYNYRFVLMCCWLLVIRATSRWVSSRDRSSSWLRCTASQAKTTSPQRSNQNWDETLGRVITFHSDLWLAVTDAADIWKASDTVDGALPGSPSQLIVMLCLCLNQSSLFNWL